MWLSSFSPMFAHQHKLNLRRAGQPTAVAPPKHVSSCPSNTTSGSVLHMTENALTRPLPIMKVALRRLSFFEMRIRKSLPFSRPTCPGVLAFLDRIGTDSRCTSICRSRLQVGVFDCWIFKPKLTIELAKGPRDFSAEKERCRHQELEQRQGAGGV